MTTDHAAESGEFFASFPVLRWLPPGPAATHPGVDPGSFALAAAMSAAAGNCHGAGIDGYFRPNCQALERGRLDALAEGFGIRFLD